MYTTLNIYRVFFTLVLFIQCGVVNVLFSQDVAFSHDSGFYTDSFSLSITFPIDYELRYTLDGSDPTISDNLYIGNVLVKNRSEEANGIALIPTNPSNTYELFRWRPPLGKVPKATVLKAALFKNDLQQSDVTYREFFVGPELAQIELPVVSIQLDSADLFDYETGIFVAGKDFDDNPNTWQPGNYFNRGDEWEKTALFSFYNNREQELSQLVNLQIHGGASRIMPCKSLRISAKENLGKAYLDYPFFKDRPWQKYKRIIIRNGGQDFYRSLFRDVLMHNLVSQSQDYYQSAQPAVIFINGIYWGIENIRERYDKYYFSNYHEEGLEQIDYVEIAMAFNAKEGSAQDFEQMIEELLILDLSKDEDFDKVKSQININNFIDLHISKIYGGGTDWSGNNERLFRAEPSEPVWNWIASDYDDTFRNFNKASFEHATNDMGENWPNPEWSTRLFRSLMTNVRFANSYRDRLRYLLRTTYHPDAVIPIIDSIANLYRNEMPRQIQRWTYPNSIDEWEAYMLEFKSFAMQRPVILMNQFGETFPEIHKTSNELSVSPNPATNQIYFAIPKGWESASYILQNALGQIIQTGNLSNSFENKISLEGLASGHYVLSVQSGKEFWSTKIQVQKS